MEPDFRTAKEESLHEADDHVDTSLTFKKHFDITKYTFSPDPNAEEVVISQTKYTTSTKLFDKQKMCQVDTSIKSFNTTRSKGRIFNGYAHPTQYAHLPELPDVLSLNLICIFVGLNPGITTAKTGHAFAHPTNLFWKLLHTSGCIPRRCHPSEDRELPELYALGTTNIVSRPTRNSSELKKTEMDAGVSVIEEKICNFRPEAVCIVGKGIWESIWRTRYGKNISKDNFRYGWQDESERMGISRGESLDWEGARIFVACSTSGLAATLKPAEKENIWRELGVWVKERRELRDLKRRVSVGA
ncbi:G/U mismatch-specific uracil DNA glycosylase [Golovinomyces cichoracearum]|uniref:G/U mismatch-specific uracil DNA glycosylase n=1 Tax=Golovinomyces cichoracearum TaxID=62708 RepID=A0A420INQ4_9PEZI|nr:G/U mismatch-specific uracil DNA glycosylase [Golovinomyces cichoracearum]